MQSLDSRRKTYLCLSGNALKLIAAVTMTVDHVGMIFFPENMILRYIGRLAFPIFAFMVAEGCHYTRNKLRYLVQLAVLALVCQAAFTVATGSWFLCVPVSFSLAVPMVYALQACKNSRKTWQAVLWGILLLALAAGVWGITRIPNVDLDYGFWGCMMPVAASLLRMPENSPRWLKKLDTHWARVAAMGLCMIPLALQMGAWQWWSLLALPLLALYSGKRGAWRMKYFFYIFYPTHLALLEGLYLLLWYGGLL